MADKLVDILGFLQPDSGNNWNAGIFLDGNARIMYAFEDATYSIQDFAYYDAASSHLVAERSADIIGRPTGGYVSYQSKSKSESAYIQNTGPKTYAELYKYLNDRKLLPDVPDKNNLPPVIVGYAGPNTNKQNIIVNINQRPIFQKVYYAKWPCLKDLESSKLLTYLATVSDHVKSYETNLLQGKVDQANSREKQFIEDLKSLNEEVQDNTKDGTWDKNKVPACFLPDPDPALVGPPSQTIYGTLNKPPAVDDPNIALPDDTVKALTPSEGLDKVTESKTKVTETITTKTQETVTGGGATVRTSFSANDPRASMTQAQLDALPNGAGQTEFKIPGKNETTTTLQSVNSSVSSVTNASGTDVVAKLQSKTDIKVATPAVPKVEAPKFVKDGLGDKWSPDKFQPSTVAGNTKFVDPVTGTVGSTEITAASDKLKSSLPDIPKPNIPTLPDIPPPTNISGADAALSKLSDTSNLGSLNPNTNIASPSELVSSAKSSVSPSLGSIAGGGLLGGGLGAGIGALAGGGKGALIGGVSGVAVGGGLAAGGVGGGLLAGAGLGGGIGAALGGGKGAAIGAASGGVLGAAAAKLAAIKKDMPKPKIPKPPNAPRIKKVKIKAPDNIKGAQQLLNLNKSTSG